MATKKKPKICSSYAKNQKESNCQALIHFFGGDFVSFREGNRQWLLYLVVEENGHL